jgi:hypothetical protein
LAAVTVAKVSTKRLLALLAAIASLALMWPAAGSADHIVTAATVDARLKERRSTDFWVVELSWTASCTGAAPGNAWFEGELYLVDLDTRERIHAGGVVSTSGASLISGKRDWFVASRERSARLMPELTIHCYENFPLHGGREVVTTGSTVIVPRRFGGGVVAAAVVVAAAIRRPRSEAAAASRRSWVRTEPTRSGAAVAARSSSASAAGTASRAGAAMTACSGTRTTTCFAASSAATG